MKILFLFLALSMGYNCNRSKHTNPVVYFEIPVLRMDRAVHFYKTVFDFEFKKMEIDSYEMSVFPFEEEALGISGSLAKGDVYVPTKNGVILYFKTANIDETLKKAISLKAKIIYPKTDTGHGYVAEMEDSEGNRIALLEDYK